MLDPSREASGGREKERREKKRERKRREKVDITLDNSF